MKTLKYSNFALVTGNPYPENKDLKLDWPLMCPCNMFEGKVVTVSLPVYGNTLVQDESKVHRVPANYYRAIKKLEGKMLERLLCSSKHSDHNFLDEWHASTIVMCARVGHETTNVMANAAYTVKDDESVSTRAFTVVGRKRMIKGAVDAANYLMKLVFERG